MTDWRDQLSDPPRPHTLAEFILLALDIAAEDARNAADDCGGVGPTARGEFADRAGFDIYDKIREIVEPIVQIPIDDEPMPGSVLILEDELDTLENIKGTIGYAIKGLRVAYSSADAIGVTEAEVVATFSWHLDHVARLARIIEQVDRQLALR